MTALAERGYSRQKRTCMMATTPFQILGCIALVKQLSLDADLYIGDSFQNSEATVRKLRELKMFRNIYLKDNDCQFSH